MDLYQQYELFRDVQMSRIFEDGKTFVDCTHESSLKELNELYLKQKQEAGFSLAAFVDRHFELPVPMQQDYILKQGSSLREHIEALWEKLIRPGQTPSGNRLGLPYTYVVPGGRFGEMYYWDTYFTMLGLQVSRKISVLEGLVRNFSHLIDTYGYIPNGTRDYFLGRSQPPYYSLMIRLLAAEFGDQVLVEYLTQLEKEYAFWMKGVRDLSGSNTSSCHVVRMKDGELLNRYWDEFDTPRPESYREDLELSREADTEAAELFRHLRSGAESGWDFSSRWFARSADFTTIHTCDIIPVDLNCLLWHLEATISEAFGLAGNAQEQARYQALAGNRSAAIRKYHWDPARSFYFDYDMLSFDFTDHYTLAAATPLYFRLASDGEAEAVAQLLRERFLKEGGLLTTLEDTGQQWDAPNGWAPLQWIAVKGLERYGHRELASEVALRWISLNSEVFERTGKLMEKYNVVDGGLAAGGGEYEGQDGFGWTNGVLLALMRDYS